MKEQIEKMRERIMKHQQTHGFETIYELLNEDLDEIEKLAKDIGVIHNINDTLPNITVLQDDSIKEKCCNNCKHNGYQMIYPSACTGCGEYNNHEYSR